MKNKFGKLILAIFMIGILETASVLAGAVLTVNDNAAGKVCNQKLSLEEAAELAEGIYVFRNVTDGEKNQISGVTWGLAPPDPLCPLAVWRVVGTGQIGLYAADDIVFTNEVTVISDSMLLGKNDDINGLKPDGTKVILDGTGLPSWRYGIGVIATESGSQIRNLEIRNFPNHGIKMLAGNGAIFEGLEIHHNGGDGIQLNVDSNVPKNNRNITIGGTQPQHRNLIYSNGLSGIAVFAYPTTDRTSAQNIKILNNYIGTRTGTTDDGNVANGIFLHDTFGVIVGDATGLTRNVISGNSWDGINIIGANAVANEIFYNFIGTDSTGGAPLGNGESGVALHEGVGSATNFTNYGPNRVGKSGFPNIISANKRGIFISDGNTANNFIQSNNIGTNVGGNADLGNFIEGIYIGMNAFNNRIGGNGANEGNLIAFNGSGIKIDSGTGNALRRNRLFSNDGLGIDLEPNGVTANDSTDSDSGANDLQNFPAITYVYAQSSSVRIQGTFNSRPNQTYTLEFFGSTAIDSSNYGEGRNFLGETAVTTNSLGNVSFDVTLPTGISSVGSWVTATATDVSGNTSEYSQARNICADLRFNPTNLFVSSAGGARSFSVINSVGCSFTATSNASWITNVTKSGTTVNFNVAQNTGLQRVGTITVTFSNGSFVTGLNFTVTQLNNGCALSLTPTSANMSKNAGTAGFSVVTTAGCTWTAVSSASWITVTSGASGTGTGTVSLSVSSNSGPPRTGTVTITGANSATAVFTVTQANGCTYSVSPANPNVLGNGGTLNLTVSASAAGCSWTAVSNASWMTVMNGMSGTGNGTVVLTVSANPGAARSGTVTVAGQTVTVNQGTSPNNAVPFDFDGDRKTDLSIFRPAVGEWWYVRSSDGQNRTETFGNSTDKLVPGDYTGDDKTDIAVWNPSTGEWFILRSENGTYYSSVFGTTGDIPTPGDFDGDGRADQAVFRPSTGVWYILRSSDGQTPNFVYGQSSDKPVIGDYDGDGKSDLAVFRPSTGQWRYLPSSGGSEQIVQFGTSTDKLVPGDYTGDGRTDMAVWNPSTGVWTIRRSEDGTTYTVTFGQSGDIPVAGDYDGDGRFDQAVFRPSVNVWYLNQSQAGMLSLGFGQAGDIPVPNAFVP